MVHPHDLALVYMERWGRDVEPYWVDEVEVAGRLLIGSYTEIGASGLHVIDLLSYTVITSILGAYTGGKIKSDGVYAYTVNGRKRDRNGNTVKEIELNGMDIHLHGGKIYCSADVWAGAGQYARIYDLDWNLEVENSLADYFDTLGSVVPFDGDHCYACGTKQDPGTWHRHIRVLRLLKTDLSVVADSGFIGPELSLYGIVWRALPASDGNIIIAQDDSHYDMTSIMRVLTSTLTFSASIDTLRRRAYTDLMEYEAKIYFTVSSYDGKVARCNLDLSGSETWLPGWYDGGYWIFSIYYDSIQGFFHFGGMRSGEDEYKVFEIVPATKEVTREVVIPRFNTEREVPDSICRVG